MKSKLVVWSILVFAYAHSESLTPTNNPLNLNDAELRASIERGRDSLITYPIKNTPIHIPHEPLKNFLESDDTNILKKLFLGISESVFEVKNFDDFYRIMGFAPFNDDREIGIYNIPKPDRWEGQPLGVTLVQTELGKGMTFSCVTCHAGTFLGKTVLGLPNKGVRANRFFVLAKQWLPLVPSTVFQTATGATDGEREMFHEAKGALEAVRALTPLALGLDTSLAHVGKSLAMRSQDEFATRNNFYQIFPRGHQLDRQRADSKPAVWWTARYKNRWLSDASISGNPVITNILWNEIGRGADLRALDQWLDSNQEITQDMTNAVLNTDSPKWGDFFPPESIQLASAMRGEKLFNKNCASCHGVYEKAWEANPNLSVEDGILTTQVVYSDTTRAIDVGTDANRWEGMKELSTQLNALSITQKNNIHIEMQRGYVPPPLVGIFARYPYFHNNSAPNLCAVLSIERPEVFYQGPSRTLNDYDQNCVGYPVGDKIPADWKNISDALVDTRKEGLSNKGHTRMLLNSDGTERYSPNDKSDIIEYLKTL